MLIGSGTVDAADTTRRATVDAARSIVGDEQADVVWQQPLVQTTAQLPQIVAVIGLRPPLVLLPLSSSLKVISL